MNAMNGNTLSYDNSIMPSIVFTDPQVASVGLTEAEARNQGLDVKTSILTLGNVPRAIAARDTREGRCGLAYYFKLEAGKGKR